MDIATQIEQAGQERLSSRPQAIASTNQGPLEINYGGKAVVLPHQIDDLQAEICLEVYRRMEAEYAVSSSAFIFAALMLSSGWSLGTAVEEPAQDVQGAERREYDIAEETRLYNERCLKRMDTPMTAVLADACEFWGDGHKLFESVFAPMRDNDGLFIQVAALKPKPQTHYRMVVTVNNDLLGAIPAKGGSLWLASVQEASDAQGFVPADRLFVVTNARGANGNPQGRAQKRCCYDPWNRKQRLKPERLRHATLFGSGRISIEGPAPNERTPMTPPRVAANGREYDLVDWLALQAQALTNGSYLILPDGWRLMVHQPQGDGGIFEANDDRCDREMIAGFLGMTRATTEAQHGSKADSGDAVSLLMEVVNYGRRVLCDAVKAQVLYRNTELRYGKEHADRYTPNFLMSAAESEDVPALLTALASARTAGVVMDDQLPFWDRKLGQPERDVAAMQEQDAAKAKAQADATVQADASFRRRAGQARAA